MFYNVQWRANQIYGVVSKYSGILAKKGIHLGIEAMLLGSNWLGTLLTLAGATNEMSSVFSESK